MRLNSKRYWKVLLKSITLIKAATEKERKKERKKVGEGEEHGKNISLASHRDVFNFA